MNEHNTDVMLHMVADHQARLRSRNRKVTVYSSGAPSRLRRFTGQTLIRIGEHVRGELREAGSQPVRSRLATR